METSLIIITSHTHPHPRSTPAVAAVNPAAAVVVVSPVQAAVAAVVVNQAAVVVAAANPVQVQAAVAVIQSIIPAAVLRPNLPPQLPPPPLTPSHVQQVHHRALPLLAPHPVTTLLAPPPVTSTAPPAPRPRPHQLRQPAVKMLPSLVAAVARTGMQSEARRSHTTVVAARQSTEHHPVQVTRSGPSPLIARKQGQVAATVLQVAKQHHQLQQ